MMNFCLFCKKELNLPNDVILYETQISCNTCGLLMAIVKTNTIVKIQYWQKSFDKYFVHGSLATRKLIIRNMDTNKQTDKIPYMSPILLNSDRIDKLLLLI